MGIKTHIVIFLLAILTFGFSLAQTDSLPPVKTVNGKQFYVHQVEKGQTLYAISKKYDVSIQIIKEVNNLEDGLKQGAELLIPVKSQESIQTVDALKENYIYHDVQKKETLYSIAKKYKVSQKEILLENPDLENGLKEGQKIKIPLKSIGNQVKKNTASSGKNKNFKEHVVKPGETLYTLSKMYQTSVDTLKKYNDLSEGLKAGAILLIPQKTSVKKGVSIAPNAILNADTLIVGRDTFKQFSDTIHIALLLPFYLDKNDELRAKATGLEKFEIYPRSKFALDFYTGFLIALDSLSKDKYINLYVYDTNGNDSIKRQEIYNELKNKKIDIIYGPLYADNFKWMAKLAKQKQIPIIAPVAIKNKLLLNNQYIQKIIPSQITQLNCITNFVVDSFKTENIVVVKQTTNSYNHLVDIFLKYYKNKLLEINDTNLYKSVKTVEMSVFNLDAIKFKLSTEKKNLIFVPTDDQAFVTEFFTKMDAAAFDRKDEPIYDITVVGLEGWEKYENIDYEYLQNLKLHLPSNQYVNYKDSSVIGFMQSYYDRFKTYPSDYAFLGYDLAMAYLSNNQLMYNGLSVDLKMFKTGIESGYENINCALITYKDYQLLKIQ